MDTLPRRSGSLAAVKVGHTQREETSHSLVSPLLSAPLTVHRLTTHGELPQHARPYIPTAVRTKSKVVALEPSHLNATMTRMTQHVLHRRGERFGCAVTFRNVGMVGGCVVVLDERRVQPAQHAVGEQIGQHPELLALHVELHDDCRLQAVTPRVAKTALQHNSAHPVCEIERLHVHRCRIVAAPDERRAPLVVLWKRRENVKQPLTVLVRRGSRVEHDDARRRVPPLQGTQRSSVVRVGLDCHRAHCRGALGDRPEEPRPRRLHPGRPALVQIGQLHAHVGSDVEIHVEAAVEAGEVVRQVVHGCILEARLDRAL
eukprot:3591885-Prymnesium_polylepis.1